MATETRIPKLEFKSGDDAWYEVAIELVGSRLKVHYEDFTEDDDEMLPLKEEFKTVEDIRSRFRFTSKQLQDNHCGRVKEGTDVCVSCSSDGDDNRFFDAVIKQVHRSKHHLVAGEEQCTCTFKVLWKAGPVANRRTSVSCENICVLIAGSIETHPVINELIRLVEEKLDSRTRSVGRKPLRSKRENTKGRDATNFKDRQARPGKRADEKGMACETTNRRDEVSLSNAKECMACEAPDKSDGVSFSNAKEFMACETPNRSDGVSLSNTKECMAGETPNRSDGVSLSNAKECMACETLNKSSEVSLSNAKECMACEAPDKSDVVSLSNAKEFMACETPNRSDGVSLSNAKDMGNITLCMAGETPNRSDGVSLSNAKECMACETLNKSDEVSLSNAKECMACEIPNRSDGVSLSNAKECMACETPNRSDGVSLSNAKEVADNPGSISSQSKEEEKKFEEELSATENVLTGYDLLLQERAASDNELKSSVESDSNVGFEANISLYSHRVTTLKEDGISSKITSLQGENDICKNDSVPPEAASLSPWNKNFQHEIVSKNGKEATIDAEVLKCKETNLNMGRKEQKPNLPDLNSFPVELETLNPYTGPVSMDMGYTDTVSDNANTTDKNFWELDDRAVIIENTWPCHSGWLEAEDCDNLLEEWKDCHNVVCNGIENSGRISKQLTIGENQKGQEITNDKSLEKHFLASWGRVKRHKHTNEMLVSERLVQDNSEKRKDTNTLENFLQPTTASDSDGFDILRSSLTTSPPKPLNPEKPLDCYRYKCGIQHQTLQNVEEIGNDVYVEEIGNDVYEDKLPVKHLRSNEVQAPKVSLVAVDDKNRESRNVDIGALKCNYLTTQSVKRIKRKDPFNTFKELSGPPEQPMKKVHINVCELTHKQADCEISPLDVRPQVVVISSDDENDLASPRKECDYGSKDFSSQHKDHVHLQEGIHTTVDPVNKLGFIQRKSCKRRKEDKMYYTAMCKGHINEPGIKEDKYYCTCRLNCQKNISATQDQCNGHSLSEKYNWSSAGSNSANIPSHLKVDPQRHCFHSTSKYCEQPSHGHMNEPGTMEDKSYCTCSFEGQKNVPVSQHQCNGDSLSEKWTCCSSGGPSHDKGDLQNIFFHSTSNECELPSHGHLSKDLKVVEREFSLSEVLILDNLEKDVSHSDVIKVVSTVACGIVQVYILPCLKFEKFTRGFIWFKDHTSLMKAYALLQDDDFFIVSSNGRPWVVIDTEDGVCINIDTEEGIFGAFTVNSQGSKLPSCGTSASEKVHFVRKGEKAYEKAKRRKDAFLKFRDNLALLHRQLKHE